MSDHPNFLHSQNAADFVEFADDSDTPRAQIAPHFVVDEGVTLLIAPASRMVLGGIHDSETGDEIATLRMQSAMAPAGLVYAFMPDEMRALGKLMIERADKIDAEAAQKASEALARAMKGDQP